MILFGKKNFNRALIQLNHHLTNRTVLIILISTRFKFVCSILCCFDKQLRTISTKMNHSLLCLYELENKLKHILIRITVVRKVNIWLNKVCNVLTVWWETTGQSLIKCESYEMLVSFTVPIYTPTVRSNFYLIKMLYIELRISCHTPYQWNGNMHTK